MRLHRVCVICLLLFMGGCGGGTGTEAEPTTAVESSAPPEGVQMRFDDATVTVEIAATLSEWQLGLMHRRNLDADAGMLFLFPEPHDGGFWMKNTLIPLSIAFLGWGGGETVVVRQRMKMEPCREDPCPLYTPRVRYDAALEVNQGWFERNGIERGSVGEIIGDLPRPR